MKGKGILDGSAMYNLVGSVKTDAIHESDGYVNAVVVKMVSNEDNRKALSNIEEG